MRRLNEMVCLSGGLLICSILLGVFAGCHGQEVYPDRPINLICPWAAGGGTDSISRQIAFLLEQDLGVPVNVINATGGGGVTGHTRGGIARADGYTLTMITVELNMLHWRGLTNITHKDFEPLMMVNRDAAAVFVRAESKWNSLKELEETIRNNPGVLKCSGTAFGGIWHVGLAGWLNLVGLNPSDVIWIAMGGAAPSLQELMAGALDIVCCSLPEGQVLLNSKRIRCLGVMSDERLTAFPDVPTFKELGVNWLMQAYRGLALPKSIPEDRFNTLAEAVERVATSESYLKFLKTSGAGAAAMPSKEFKEFLQITDNKFGDIMTSEAFATVQQRYGPMFFPKMLLGMFVVCIVALLWSGGLRRSQSVENITSEGMIDLGFVIACVSAYVVMAEFLGFIITAALLFLILFWRMGVRWSVAIPVSLFLVPLLYQIFAIYLRVALPRGWLGW